jgi:RNA polymerase sigma factor (TIGR02999 family)
LRIATSFIVEIGNGSAKATPVLLPVLASKSQSGEANSVASTISGLILSADEGDRPAADGLFAALYRELHELARRQLARGPGATLGTTTLLHEAYLNISGREASFPDRARFMGYAAKVMRGLVIDYARSRQALKRGGGFALTASLDDVAEPAADAAELERVGEALERLAAADPALAELVDLKFFGGFSLQEIGEMRGVSERTVQRHWDKARTYLYSAIQRNA